MADNVPDPSHRGCGPCELEVHDQCYWKTGDDDGCECWCHADWVRFAGRREVEK